MKIAWVILFLFIGFNTSAQVLRKRTTLLMGGRFDITIVAKDSSQAEQNIDTIIHEISRIENLISDWKSETQIGQVNLYAGIKAIKVDTEVLALTQRAIKLSQITNGAFDVSFAAMDKIWKFDGSMTRKPTPQEVKKAVEKVGYQNIELDTINSTIFLKKKGMKLGFGALGEGYAADKCREMMLSKGIKAGIVNGSGDMSTWGKQPDGSYWKIGITNPLNKDSLLTIIDLNETAIVTSGNYEKYVIFNKKRYSHIINPATGYPSTGLISATILGPSAETANGLSTSIMVLGRKKGIRLLKSFPQYSGIIINDKGKIYSSRKLEIAHSKLIN